MFSTFFHKNFENDILKHEVEIVFREHAKPSFINDYWNSYYYDICLKGTNKKVGRCDIRTGMNEELYYAGNIGYRIFEEYRGNGFAYQASKQLLAEARKLGMEEIIITCSPENIASKKTIEKLGAILLETSDVPNNHYLYKQGEKVKHIYRIPL